MQKLFVRGWSLIQRLKVSSDPWALRLAGEYLPRTFSWRTHWATKLICETRVFFFVLETHFEIYGPVARTRYTFTQRRNYTRQRGSAWLKKRQKNWLLCSFNFLSIFRQVWLLSANFYSRSFDATCMNLKELQWGMSNRLVLCLYLRKIQKAISVTFLNLISTRKFCSNIQKHFLKNIVQFIKVLWFFEW